ncbi:TPR domain-containing protein [Photobacterium chitinilyticum]|uniref:TPR domain-containing protein n=1 Tax=Photobacterium chitinilyticum TaxID=2485123 RepID=UPI001F1C4A98|nr:nitrite reductase [Photobacterium chitinilyticum]
MEFGIGFTVLLVVGLLIIWRGHASSDRESARTPILLSIVLLALSVGVYAFLGQPTYQPAGGVSNEAENSDLAGLTGTEFNQKRIEEIQNKLRDDKQNGELWYALGNAYMYASEYANAALSFSYSARLADEPQANIFSAQATAIYYRDGQRLSTEVDQLLDQALALDENNLPTLMLLASDYFLNARYQKAIDTWQQALDSEHPDLNRVELITAINRAKKLL